MVAQTHNPSVSCIPWLSWSAWGVHSDLLQGSTPQTPHFHWSINVSQSVILLSVIHWSWEVWVPGSPRGIPQRYLLPPQFCLALLVVSTAGFSRGTTCLICWRGSSTLYWFRWRVAINDWLDKFMSIYVGTVNPLRHWIKIPFGTISRIPLRGLSGFRVTLWLVVPEQLDMSKLRMS